MLISNSLYVYINFITTKIKFISLILKAQEKKRDEKKIVNLLSQSCWLLDL